MNSSFKGDTPDPTALFDVLIPTYFCMKFVDDPHSAKDHPFWQQVAGCALCGTSVFSQKIITFIRMIVRPDPKGYALIVTPRPVCQKCAGSIDRKLTHMEGNLFKHMVGMCGMIQASDKTLNAKSHDFSPEAYVDYVIRDVLDGVHNKVIHPKECEQCGLPPSPKGKLKCSACLSVYYCNSTCQRAHWPKHKTRCSEIYYMLLVPKSKWIILKNNN